MSSPIICFGQQPCGIFPRRFLFAKIQTARRLQQEIGGEIVFFYHDSDHDPRETVTILRETHTEREFQRLNFTFANQIQKQFSPLFAKRVLPEWKEKTGRATSAAASALRWSSIPERRSGERGRFLPRDVSAARFARRHRVDALG